MSKNWAKGALNSVVINVPQEDVQLGQESNKTICKNCQKEVIQFDNVFIHITIL